MKGMFFRKPFEFSLEVAGESWKQGEKISGVLRVKNHSAETGPGYQVCLARASLKKVKDKALGAMTILETRSWDADSGETSFPWEFETSSSFPITDSTESAYLLYGSGENPDELGRLQLLVEPSPEIQGFIGVFETEFRFVKKGWKQSKRGVEVKLAPPASKAFAMLERAVLTFECRNELLLVDYDFQVKKVNADAASLSVTKASKNFAQELELKAFRTPYGRLDSDQMGKWIREAIDQVESKVVY